MSSIEARRRLHPIDVAEDSRTPQSLARIIASTRANGVTGRRVASFRQLLPTAAPRHRSRASAFDLTLKLKALGYRWSEVEVSASLAILCSLGLVNRGNGGYAVVDWDALTQHGNGDGDG